MVYGRPQLPGLVGECGQGLGRSVVVVVDMLLNVPTWVDVSAQTPLVQFVEVMRAPPFCGTTESFL
jgi:hypothetical protein